ncbi:MAG: type IX secretion system outer membrane channel protein PorV [Bacteroidota bacterium]|nr:type IX secretion system outer membrane channel protein PorV [Bacteroidota bacterium]
MKKDLILVFIISLLISENINSQKERRVITTAVPFLLISSDARASGLGDQGVSTSADNFSQHWNQSKFIFTENNSGFGFSYTPYLSSVVSDVFLGNLTYFRRNSERSVWSFSLKYFSLGEIDILENPLDIPIVESPNEFTIDAGYGLRLSDNLSLGITGRFLLSDVKLQSFDSDTDLASSVAVDISGFYQSNSFKLGNNNAIYRAGFNISNLGPKMKYSEMGEENFIPSNFRIGSGLEFIYDSNNSLTLTIEINKLLVPTPNVPVYGTDGSTIVSYSQPDIGFLSGIFKSFNDAPDGFSEELKELTYSLGLEYSFNDVFFLRSGYFDEHELKGSRKFFTLGAGFNTQSNFQIDLSYLISTSDVISPLENTLRFSLSYNIFD